MSKRKRRVNWTRVFMALSILLSMSYFLIDYFKVTAMDVEIPEPTIEVVWIEAEEPELSPVIPQELTYDPVKIQEEVIEQSKRYFNISNFTDVIIESPRDMDVWESYYQHDIRTIVVGIAGVENDSEFYRMVFTHEYAHYLLHQLGLENDNAHESIADTYTWFTNKEYNEKQWGKLDEGREYPYDIVMDKILIDNNFKCLSKVFTPNNKIDNFGEFLNRISTECEIDITYLINNY